MNKQKLFMLMAIFLCLLPLAAMATALPPIISTEETAAALTNPDLIILDIRKIEEYKAGHIPGAISMFYGTLAIKRGDSDNELTPDDELIDILGSAGIKPEDRKSVV